jgi:hypothetical protein
MAKLVVSCPSCGGDLRATRLACVSCGTNLEGQFDIPSLLQLPADDLAFVVEFVRSSGSTSYPTVRNRLDQIIARLDSQQAALQHKRSEILDALEGGRLSTKEAEEQLRKVGL